MLKNPIDMSGETDRAFDIHEVNLCHVETVALLTRKKDAERIDIEMTVDKEDVTEKAIYQNIKDYVKEKYDLNVHTKYIAEVKRKHGLPMQEASNKVDVSERGYPLCLEEKVKAQAATLCAIPVIAGNLLGIVGSMGLLQMVNAPILISLPLVLIAVGYLLRTSYVEVGSGKFYSEYRAYCARVGDFTRSTTEFYNAVEQAGFKRVKKKHSMWILGLRLLEGDFAVRGSKPGARFTVADVKDCMQQKEQEIQKESAKPHPKHHMKPMMNFRRNTKFQRMTIPSFTVRHLMISIRNGREEMLYQIK